MKFSDAIMRPLDFPTCEEAKHHVIRKLDDARACLRKAASFSQGRESLLASIDFLESWISLASGNYAEALRRLEALSSCRQGVLDDPENADLAQQVLMMNGTLLAALQRPREARPILEKALKFDTEKGGDFFYYLGLCYLNLNELEQAKQNFLEASSKGVPPEFDLPLHLCMGECYFRLGAFAWAKSEFEYCLEKRPHSGLDLKELFSWLAAACAALGLDEEAAKYRELEKRA